MEGEQLIENSRIIMEDIGDHITANCLAIAQIVIEMDEMARQVYNDTAFSKIQVAAELAVKNSSTVIPGVHVVAFDFISLSQEQQDDRLIYQLQLKAIHKTGIETQALYGISVAGLSLKEFIGSKGKVRIGAPQIIKSNSPYSTDKRMFPSGLTAAVVVCSDSISDGSKTDAAGKAIIAELEKYQIKVNHYQVIPDEKEIISQCATSLSKEHHLLIYTGGTGLSLRDVTPEALEPLIHRRIPGIEEAIRAYGQQRVPFAMLSRSLVGTIGNCLVMAIPGSTKGASESMKAVFPHLLHVFKILRGQTQH
ncbi:bifunctional molybdenum cofactor biosynthesis protein MoaC/MogA [Galbibacter marinus]|uniref:Bifunctional molybdenum cofactor biosynthesis protein MoaC/MogA n=2 Tax=Galbibacter marinus TaxID=555500 RepID=K2PT10_9FLAO|nr:bifunctional molybdenum cofactor biosynthesis protein MoaC/MogA [Galbibacter marinus]